MSEVVEMLMGLATEYAELCMDVARMEVGDKKLSAAKKAGEAENRLRTALAESLGGWRPISEADKNGHSRITGVWTQGEWLTFGMSFWNDEDSGYWWDVLRAQRIRNQPTHTLDVPEYPPINKRPEATP